MKLVVWSEPAKRDVEDAAYWYAEQSGIELGERFLAAVEQALDHIARHPKAGSSRYGVELKLAQLRFWPIRRFPYLVFYMEGGQHIEVGRVLHAERDIPAWMENNS